VQSTQLPAIHTGVFPVHGVLFSQAPLELQNCGVSVPKHWVGVLFGVHATQAPLRHTAVAPPHAAAAFAQ
jgi:hypothetical protein